MLGRCIRGLLASIGVCLPALALWLLIVAILDHRDRVRSAAYGQAPNPAKAPAWMFGPVTVVVYADPYLAGTIYLWLYPGALLAGMVVLWAIGVPVLTKPSAGWPAPSPLKVTLVSLGVGLFLALPWIYALALVYREPILWE
jgi:hypothetical protein